jgi:unsaturated chondroitin disaccharide hydrolase
MEIETSITPEQLLQPLAGLFELALQKVRLLNESWDRTKGTPVFTVGGKYTTRGWTEWTQGFQYGCALLCFDATGQRDMLDLGRKKTVELMAPHVTHTGVHDHGFNNLSTYGNLRRLCREGKIQHEAWEMAFYEMAIKASGAVQAARWSGTSDHGGYIYSFNGPHSLFIDTMRTARILGLAWQLGHKLMHENDRSADLLKRSVLHGLCTNRHIIFHGNSGHTYDVRGRTSHEGIFNRNDGNFRCRSTQQGYSPFSTWTRGLAWAILGYAEELEFFDTIPAARFEESTRLPKVEVMKTYEQAAIDTADHYLQDCTASDGIPYWDAGAPGLAHLGDWQSRPADPYNDHEPVDASAAAIAAQGLLRIGRYLIDHGRSEGSRYKRAGLTVAKHLLAQPYLSGKADHEGLLLQSVYHRPNGWDNVPAGRTVPCDESSMWGDYHMLELALLIQRLAERDVYPTFFDQANGQETARANA